MRLHDRNLAPIVSGMNGLTGVRYRVHEDEDSVDDSDYSLADEGEAEHQIIRRKQKQGQSKIIAVQRKTQPDADDESVSSEDGSFFTLASRHSILASGEVLIQQLSFDSGSNQNVPKHSVILTTSPNITKKDDMLMSDDDDEFQEYTPHGRIHLDPVPVLDSGLLADDLDDNSSTMSSLLGEEHLFFGRTDSNASLSGFGLSDLRDVIIKDSGSSTRVLQSSAKSDNKTTHDQRSYNTVNKTLVNISTKYPPISATISTDSWSSDEILWPKLIQGNAIPLKYQRPRDRLNSAASSSSLIFNYSDGEASFAANTDPKSHNLPPKRRMMNANSQIRRADRNNETDCHESPHVPTTPLQNVENHLTGSESSIPDNDIPAIKSLASGSCSIELVSHQKGSFQAASNSVPHIETYNSNLSLVEEKDSSIISHDLILDDIDWVTPIDHSFTTVDTPPFFTISIPKNWKQQEECMGHLKKKGKAGIFKDAKNPKESTHGSKGKPVTGIPRTEIQREVNQGNNWKNISLRAVQQECSVKRSDMSHGLSDRRSYRLSSKPRMWRQTAIRSQKHKDKTEQDNPDSTYLRETTVSKRSSIVDDNRSVSSHQTFWSTQSDGLLAQKKHTSILRINHADSAKDDNKSVQSRGSLSSFRSFWSSMSWKASRRQKSGAHRSRRVGIKASNDKVNRWQWLLSLFGGKKDFNYQERSNIKKSKAFTPTSHQVDEDMTTPTAAMSDLSFSSNKLHDSFLSENGHASVIGKVKVSNNKY